MKYCEQVVSPDMFNKWVAIATAAAALERRVWSNWFGLEQTVYPNLYTILIGPPGAAKKSSALNVGKSLLALNNFPLGANKTSKEALVKRLISTKSPVDAYPSKDGVMQSQMALTIICSEFGALVQEDKDMTRDLTDLFDSPNAWEYDILSRPGQVLENVCLNLLGATTPGDLADSLPKQAIGGGFTSRFIFVYEEKGKYMPKPQANTLPRLNLREKLIAHVGRLAKLQGEMTSDDTWEALWGRWYHHVFHNPRFSDHRLKYYNERRLLFTLKLSMIMCAVRGDSLIMTGADLKAAIDALQEVEVKMGMTYSLFGSTRDAAQIQRLFDFIEAEKEISVSRLKSIFRREMKPEDFDDYIKSFVEERAIEIEEREGTNIIRFLLRQDSTNASGHYDGKEATG